MAKGDWEVRGQRTGIAKKIRSVPVDAVELASTIAVGEQGLGLFFVSELESTHKIFRRDLTMGGASGEVARSSGSEEYTTPNTACSDALRPPFGP